MLFLFLSIACRSHGLEGPNAHSPPLTNESALFACALLARDLCQFASPVIKVRMFASSESVVSLTLDLRTFSNSTSRREREIYEGEIYGVCFMARRDLKIQIQSNRRFEASKSLTWMY